MTAYHAARIRNARKINRYEVRTFINDETCGYEIFDNAFGRVVDRDTGYDGNYASQRAGDDAKERLEHPEWFVNFGLGGGNGGFCTDRGDW
jgi:hypothetical protein